jgi:hypothetical protein
LAAVVAGVASSYSTDLTWVMGMVREMLSSPSTEISAVELAVTVPITLVPSRMKIVACGREPVSCFAQDEMSKPEKIAMITEICRMRITP